MIQIAIDIAGPPPAPPRAAPASAAGGGFERMIERLAVAEPNPESLPLPLPPLPLPGAALPPERQDLAGEEEEGAPPAAEEDEEIAGEPIWLPPTMAPSPRETLPKLSLHESTLPLVVEAGRGDRRFVAEELTLAANEEAPAPPVDLPEIQAEAEPETRERMPTSDVHMLDPRPAAAAPGVQAAALPAVLGPQPAAIAFAAQLLEPARPEPAVEPSSQGAESLTGVTAPLPAAARVEPARQTQDAPLDMGRDDWIESMIERIETMREEGGDRAAQIRLRPDALGTVDVRIRHEGAQVHIHFAAETAAARTLLNDAAPRLGELAEARGLKLGDTGVGQGFGGERRDASPAPDPRAPNRAPRTAQPTQTDRSGERIA